MRDVDMNSTKLIIIEGIPGSGKTMTSQAVKELLEQKGIECRLYQEGNLDHPADFESVACLNPEQWVGLKEKYYGYKELLNSNAVTKGNDTFVNYRKLQNEYGATISEELVNDLSSFDVCDGLSSNDYLRLTKDRWETFAKNAEDNDEVIILECCFIQNPLVILLGKHNLNRNIIMEHIFYNEETIKRLNPYIVYLYQDSVKETIERVSKVRDKAWIEFVINYLTNGEYCKENNLKALDGTIKFFEERRELELEIFEKLKLNKILVDNSEYNYEKSLKTVLKHIGEII